MAKLTLQSITGSYASVAKLNANFTAIEDALENTLSRDGSTPNQWEATLDANDNTIINLPLATELTSPVTLQQLQDYVASSSSGLISVQRDTATATAGQTVFNLLISYTQGVNNLFVFRNGAKLRNAVDYTETSSTSITLTSGANEGDVFEFFCNIPTTSQVTQASAVTIVDGNSRYASSNVEDALQEAALATTTIYTPAGTGAVTTNVQAKLREHVSVTDFGAVGDGVTDDTAAIQAAIDSLGAGGGFVWISRGVLYTYASLTVPQNVTLYDEANNRIVFHDCALEDGSATNLLIRNPSTGATRVHIEPKGVVDSGTASKLDIMLDPYQEDSSNYRILGLFTNNGDTWAKGWPGVICVNSKAVGNFYGAFPPIVFGFNDLTSSANGAMKVMLVDKTDNTVYTPHKGAWRSGMSVTTNDYAINYSAPNYVLYRATTTGTTGATPPSHLAGTASDGGVTWQYIKNYTTVAAGGNFLAMTLFGQRDDIPVAGSLSYNVQFARGAAWHDGQHAAHLNSSGAVAGYRSNVGSDLYDYFSGGTHLMRYTSTFRQHQGGATLCATKTNTDNSTSLDASLCDTLILSNTSPTNISTVVSTVHQYFFVRATNANSTLVHSGSLYLRGAVNRTLAAGEVALFYAGSNNAAREVGA